MRVVGLIGFWLASIGVATGAQAANYGNELACDLYAQGGGSAVFAGDAEGRYYLLVTPTEVVGLEWGCSRAGDILSCSAEEREWTKVVTIREDAAAGTLTYTDEVGTVTLSRCE